MKAHERSQVRSLIGMKDGHSGAVVVKMSEDFSKFNAEALQITCMRVQLNDCGKE